MTAGLAQVGLTLWVGFGLVLAGAIAVALPVIRRVLERLAPADRAVVLRGLMVAPLVGSALLTFLCFAPKLLGLVVPELDHCLEHGGHHLHFCLRHGPAEVFHPSFWAAASLVAGAAGWILVQRVAAVRGVIRATTTLLRTARHDVERDLWIVDSEDALALSLWSSARPTVVSKGLVDGVAPEVLDVVRAHEAAHAERRDGAWAIAVHLLGWAHLPVVGRLLRDDLTIATEQACDDRAASSVGDRMAVATSLLAVARLRTSSRGETALVPRFDGHAIEARIHALVDGADARTCPPGLSVVVLAGAGIALALLANPLHHLLETLFHTITG